MGICKGLEKRSKACAQEECVLCWKSGQDKSGVSVDQVRA
jgi:uncharacterized UBP type Zn finger protein